MNKLFANFIAGLCCIRYWRRFCNTINQVAWLQILWRL